MKKKIAGALVASLLIGSAPGWAQAQNATSKPTVEAGAQRQQFRDSIDRAIDRVPNEPRAEGTQLTAQERRDLETRRAALQTDPVGRGSGGIVMLLVGTALSIGVTAYLMNKAKKDGTIPTMARR